MTVTKMHTVGLCKSSNIVLGEKKPRHFFPEILQYDDCKFHMKWYLRQGNFAVFSVHSADTIMLKTSLLKLLQLMISLIRL